MVAYVNNSCGLNPPGAPAIIVALPNGFHENFIHRETLAIDVQFLLIFTIYYTVNVFFDHVTCHVA